MKKIILILLLILVVPNFVFAELHKVRVVAYPLTLPGNGKAASGLKLNKSHCGIIVALSHDLAKRYKKGDKFKLYLPGSNKMIKAVYQDLMHPKHSNMVDILLPTIKDCRNFGSQKGILIKDE